MCDPEVAMPRSLTLNPGTETETGTGSGGIRGLHAMHFRMSPTF